MKHILKGDFIDGVFLFSFLQAKMLQKYEKNLTKSIILNIIFLCITEMLQTCKQRKENITQGMKL